MGDPVRSLEAIPLFAELSAPERERLGRVLEERIFQRDRQIEQEGGSWNGLHIVKSGRVKLGKRSMGRELTMAIVEPGEPLNIAPLFGGGANVFGAHALTRVSTYYLPAAVTRAFVSEHPAVQKALLRALNMRIRKLASLASEVSFTGVDARLAAWLLAEARDKGIQTERGIAIKRELSTRDLASLMGTVRRVISRALAELRCQEIVEVTRNRIVILDQDKLRARVQEH